MPTYDEIEVSVGMMIEVANWRGPVLRASYGGGYGDSAIVDNSAGLHLWTLKQAQLPGDVALVPINGLSRHDYYTQFFKDHTTGTTEIFIINWRGKKYHASFADPDMDVTRVAFKIGNPDWLTGGGLKIKQRRISGFMYNADGSIDSTPPSVPVLVALTVTGAFSIQIDWLASTDLPGEIYTLAGYEVNIDGPSIFDVGNVLTFTYGFFGAGSGHSFRVRSYDAGGNRSDWSNTLIGTTDASTDVLLTDDDGEFLTDDDGTMLTDG